MTKPCLHYYQQIVVPVAMLAGLAITRFRRSLTERAAIRVRIWRWVSVISAVLALRAAMPLLAEPVRRARGFDYQAEVVQFDHWLKTWSPGEAAIYAPKKERR